MLPKQPDKFGDAPAKQFSKATGKELIQANSKCGKKAGGAKIAEKFIAGSDKDVSTPRALQLVVFRAAQL